MNRAGRILFLSQPFQIDSANSGSWPQRTFANRKLAYPGWPASIPNRAKQCFAVPQISQLEEDWLWRSDSPDQHRYATSAFVSSAHGSAPPMWVQAQGQRARLARALH